MKTIRAAIGSIALHGVVIALGYGLLTDGPDAPDIHVPEPTTIDIAVAPKPPPPPPLPPPPPPSSPASARPAPASTGRRSIAHTSLLPAPHAADPYGELTVSVDTPLGPDADGPGDRGIGGIGTGGTGPGGAGTPAIPVTAALPSIPEPPQVSRARLPRPRFDYSEVTIHGSRAYMGKAIELLLTIDPHGVVRGARITRSVERHFDLRAVARALKFEFDPGLDASGQPTTAKVAWTFIVTL